MRALVAGTGALPAALLARHPDMLVCAMDGFAPAVPVDVPFRIEHLGSLLANLRARGVTEVCLAGAVRRPAIDARAIDAATAPLVPALKAAMAKGDDGALRGIIAMFEGAGLRIVAAHDLAPDLLPPAGVPTRARPGPAHDADARAGVAEVAALGAADAGQACVVRAARVIAREGPEGTDAMLATLAPAGPAPADDPFFAAMDLAGDLIGQAAGWLGGDGGILYKAPKPGQDRRADLPLIGPATAEGAARAGLAGLVVAAGGVMVLDLPGVIRRLDEAGLFLWVRPEGGA